MKKIALAVLLAATVFALDPPEPITGTALLISKSGKSSLGFGTTNFSFSMPDGWGIGESQADSATASKKYLLFPEIEAWGCILEMYEFDHETKAVEEVTRLKNTFVNVSDLPNGFEASVGNALYSCYKNEKYVVQIWYSLPYNQQLDRELWNALKTCVTVSEEKKTPLSFSYFEKKTPKSNEWVPVTEHKWKGWICHHPSNNLHVLLTSSYDFYPNNNPRLKHLINVQNIRASGYFYIKWDQENLDTEAPYKQHLQEITDEITSIDKTQKFLEPASYYLKDGFGIRKGDPYSIITLSGDTFLFGFALKHRLKYESYSVVDFVENVEWWFDEEVKE